jgi:hypothetical protein
MMFDKDKPAERIDRKTKEERGRGRGEGGKGVRDV